MMLKSCLLALWIGLRTLAGMSSNPAILSPTIPPQSSTTSVKQVFLAASTNNSTITDTAVSSQTSTNKSINYLNQIRALGIEILPGSSHDPSSQDNPAALQQCAALAYNTLRVMPQDTVSKIRQITFYFSTNGRRGLGGGSTIILRCNNVSNEELTAVLIHELGHITDSSVLSGNPLAGKSEFMDGRQPVYLDDKSLLFYRISFSNEKTLKTGSKTEDFVSGYAMSDPFEDFAETYNYYVLHSQAFRHLASDNNQLLAKYNFMKDYVFAGHEYNWDQGVDLIGDLSRPYDVTLLGYNLKDFLAN